MLLWPFRKIDRIKFYITLSSILYKKSISRYLGFKEILWPNYTILYIRWFQNHYPLTLPAWIMLKFIT